MKITIVGSLKFAKEIIEISKKIRELGHEPLMHDHMFGIADGSAKDLIKDIAEDHGAMKRKYDIFKAWHDLIKSGDALLVCNFDKDGIENYIGGNVLLEMGFAHVNDKKIFLLNPIPEEVPYVDEVKALVDVIINKDLSKVK
ncbi:MAG: hypothetical protein QF362_02470 [Candidatus Woesearchaeota archaeon]|jgi:hypothetical protein|nr:hypothetical protein [Candidatus Woesearchaeota archaeon]MDP7506284.1 hypothetical protein [Candidatus Woesearchaeota archaeon]|tara:strand:+ start:1856 stop:2281 length:426 start_codon:yes stop_codon:yes gene_type:complete